MKRYVVIAILLAASLLMFLSERFVLYMMTHTDGWPHGIIVCLIAFFITAPTLLVVMIVYDVSVKLAHRGLKLKIGAARLLAIAALSAVLFGIPFAVGQRLEMHVKAELAKDMPVAADQSTFPRPHVRYEQAGRDKERCDLHCRKLLLEDVVASYTAVNSDSKAQVTYAFAAGGTCLGVDALTFGRVRPMDYTGQRIDGRCIVAVDDAVQPDLIATEVRFPPDSHMRGTRTTIIAAATQDVLYVRSIIWPEMPFFILGLVTDDIDQGGSPITFGLTRSPAERREGITQTVTQALEALSQA